jgi:methyltransferase (TIGR00027 family)
MPRTNDDSWDLTAGVGATATMAAAARAVASRDPQPVVNDPFAGILVRAVGLPLFRRIVDGLVDFSDIGASWFPPVFGVRSRFIDDFVTDACDAGIRQAVILASGLDCRAYRLDWPSAMWVYEVDQPEVIDWKQDVLSTLDCTPAAYLRSVGIDLRRDWPTALLDAGFDSAAPTVWIAEGILIGYLSGATHNEILDAITILSVSGSRMVADHFDVGQPDALSEIMNDLHDIWRRHDPTLNLSGLAYSGPRNDPAEYLTGRGWATRTTDLGGLFGAADRPVPAAPDLPETLNSFRVLTGNLD